MFLLVLAQFPRQLLLRKAKAALRSQISGFKPENSTPQN
jgi:hypothetical protein